MGFDLYGKNGGYFRANVWSWRPLTMLIKTTGVLTEAELRAIQFNDGYTITADKANKLADALDGGVKTEVRFPLEQSIRVHEHPDGSGTFCNDPTCDQLHKSPYRIEADHVQEFVQFCRESGGFEVW